MSKDYFIWEFVIPVSAIVLMAIAFIYAHFLFEGFASLPVNNPQKLDFGAWRPVIGPASTTPIKPIQSVYNPSCVKLEDGEKVCER